MNKRTLLCYFHNYRKALSLLIAAIHLLDNEPYMQKINIKTKELLKDGLIQRFEFTHELAWKTMKCYLEYNGYEIIVSGPLYIISKSLEIGLLSNIKWKDSIEFRKLISKINDEETKKDVKNVVSKMSSFLGDSNSADNENGMALYTTIGADFLFDAKSVYTGRGYVQAQFYSDPKNFYLIGLSNIPPIAPNSPEYDIYGSKIKYSELAISLQYSHIFANVFGVRFGVFDNTLGLAADIYPLKNNNLAISLEAYDFNTYQNSLDVYTKAYIRWHFYKGIFIQAGVEDIIGNVNRMYMVGAGYRFKPTEIGKVAKNKEEAVKKEENTIYKDYEEQKDEQKQMEKNDNTEKQVIKEDKEENNKKENNDNKKSKKNDDFFDSLVY